MPKEKFDTFVLPTDHRVVRTSGWTEGLFIPKGAAHPEQATRLFDVLLTPRAQRTFAGFRTPARELDPPGAEAQPLAAKWLRWSRQYPHYSIQDQALPKDVAEAYYQIQSDVAQRNITATTAAEQMQKAVSGWKRGDA
ncbi:extracellular solute-binding protein [Streptomyces ochraceiscleroticus]|uniref:Extracellular solute-binding protein n=1 Tax=Streptomyces ochraceiscleroticus TaxID=47761 RepID=A0ABW1ML20_9ACTN|nr:extracellular solute-binding protein [Streptomyces ochraceiscleroticus]